MKIKLDYKAYLKYLIGVIITGLGVVLVYSANLGSAPTSTFAEGLANLLNIQKGSANVLMNVVVFIIVVLANRKNVGIGTILSTFSFGIFINIWTPIVAMFVQPQTYGIRILVCLIGIIIEAYGLSYYMRADLGYGALELLADFISKTFKTSFAIAKQSMDFMFMVVGFLLGGAVGLGTVMATLLIGYLVDKFLQKGKKE